MRDDRVIDIILDCPWECFFDILLKMKEKIVDEDLVRRSVVIVYDGPCL